MNTVERVKQMCKEKKISLSKLEKDCGFANGYLRNLKKGTLPDDRLGIVANYLDTSAEFLTTGISAMISNHDIEFLKTLKEENEELFDCTMKYLRAIYEIYKRKE